MPDLDLVGVERSFGDLAVLRGVDLAVPNGDVVAVLGPSGCGKTTLLRLVAGLDPVDAGTITLGGRVLSGRGVHVDAAARGVGMIFQDGALFPFLDVARNVTFGLERPARRGASTAESWLDLVGIGGLGGRRIDELSGGQRQRVALARALAPGPAVLLLDEPFANLDAALRAELRREVRSLLRGRGTTALLVTHDRAEAFELADRVAVMLDGRLAQVGTPDELLGHPASLAVARVIGDPQELPVPPGVDGTPAVALYWPEQLELVAPPDGSSRPGAGPLDLGVEAEVDAVTVEGATVAITCRTASGSSVLVRRLRSSSPGEALPGPGAKVVLRATSAPALVTGA